MKYDITTMFSPVMPKLGKGLEWLNFLLSMASKDMREPLVPMLFPILGAHVCGCEFMYPDQTWKPLCGMMANLVADSGCNKGQLSTLIEAICRDLREHDKAEMQKLMEWQSVVKTKSANAGKPQRPPVAFLFLPADTTRPAYLQNAMACENLGGMTQLLNFPEVEMADGLCGGHKQFSHMSRNIFDCQRAGALRATVDGVTGNPILRTNITISSTPYATRKFYKYEVHNGTLGRIVFSYKPRTNRDGKIPRQGRYTEEFYEKLDEYLARLKKSSGRFIIKPLNKLADKLAQDMATLADLADDDILWDMSKRAIVNAWKAGCVMWLLNNQTWTKAMSEMVEWLVYHDCWSKLQVFSDMLKKDSDSAIDSKQNGPKNMLDSLEDSFTETSLEALRLSLDKPKEGTKRQLRVWKNRGFITYSEETGLYSKTEEYLKRNG